MTRYILAAWLFVAVVVLVIVSAIVPQFPDWLTGLVAWGACLLLWPRLSRNQARVTLLLVAFGAAGVLWGAASGKAGLFEKALAQNIALIAMLISVSFLQLISISPGAANEPLSTGRYALLKTLIGVHLFGAVINFSAVAIFADRLGTRAKLTLAQALGLTQAFMVGALWSPFFGAMAVALIAAPGASLARLMAVGIPVTVAAVLITWLTLSSKRYGHARDFAGYPLHLESLWVPAVLAIGVLVVHELKPAWSVLAIIAALAPLVTIITLLVREGNRALASVKRLIDVRLPEMNGEMSLFLAAGVLSAGMSGMIAALDLELPFQRFGGFEASVVLAVIILFAWLGLHAVIMVSVMGPWLAPLNPDPTLLAMTFLMTWGVGLQACPMSNTLLAMHSRYGIPYKEVLAHNRVYSFKLMLLCIVALNLYSAYAL
ncbi:MAG: hypothetical protein AABZ67_08440 [Pseudomonadota bacterium]